MDVTFPLFGLTAHAYGLCVSVAALLLLSLMGMLGYVSRMPAGTVRFFGLIGIPLGILGAARFIARLTSAAFVETYENPWLMFNFFDGGAVDDGAAVRAGAGRLPYLACDEGTLWPRA